MRKTVDGIHPVADDAVSLPPQVSRSISLAASSPLGFTFSPSRRTFLPTAKDSP
jgi:hypothetical protein